MSDPYKVLNVSPDASDDEIKRAYRNLAKKYHPDRYQNSPLAEKASEKMKEINAAYDEILSARKNGGSAGGSYYGSYSDSSGASCWNNVRMLINQGAFEQAEQILSSAAPTERDAEWYYLMSVILYKKGWLEDAFNYAGTACREQPDNAEYRSFYESIKRQRRGSAGGYSPSSSSGCCTSDGCFDCCQFISCLMCSDLCCNCCSGN